MPVPSNPEGFVNINTKTIAFNTVPIKIQGLNFPHFVLVLSTTNPIIGSLNASHTLATRNRLPTKSGVNPIVSVK